MSNNGGQHWGFYWRLPSLLLLRLHMPKSVQATKSWSISGSTNQQDIWSCYPGVELQHQRECSFKSIGFHQYTSPWRRVVFLFLRRLLVSNNKHPSILARAVHKQWSSWNLCSHKVKKVALTEFNTYCLFTNGRSTLSFLVKLSQVWACNFRAFQVMFFAVCCGSKLISSGSFT
jgi:hypothetical protein